MIYMCDDTKVSDLTLIHNDCDCTDIPVKKEARSFRRATMLDDPPTDSNEILSAPRAEDDVIPLDVEREGLVVGL